MEDCQHSLEMLGMDPYYLQTLPGGTQSTGQLGAWTAQPSEYAVEVLSEEHIVAAVNFARDFNLRVVVKGTGHDYDGRSSYPGSLLIWTHSMRELEFHEEFSPAGCGRAGVPAVTAGAGITWVDVYLEATERDLYVQGGGCTSVGVVGWMIGGGYGTFSKMFGTGPANLLEARVVTAGGEVVTASECSNPDLFYALRGGGHGFGVVVSLTMRTHPLPEHIGNAHVEVYASSDEAYTLLVQTFLDFYNSNLLGVNYGDGFVLMPMYRHLGMGFHSINLTREEIEADFKPFTDWLSQNTEMYFFYADISSMPGWQYWTVGPWNEDSVISTPYDPREPDRAYFRKANLGEISSYWLEYSSRYLRVDQILEDVSLGAQTLIDLARATGRLDVHTNKGQYGAAQWAVDELEHTPTHPSVKDSFGLVITATAVNHYSPLVPNTLQWKTSNILEIQLLCGSVNLTECAWRQRYEEGFQKFRDLTPGAGAYFNEADFFEPEFQENFWGAENYERLRSIRAVWDPTGLFYCHHCVGSEDWEEGGMCRRQG
jgi:hypothetical protein